MIVVDGVALQPNLGIPSSITNYWQNVISEWLKSGFSQDFIVLVRKSQSMPLPDDTVVALIPDYCLEDAEADHVGLQSACDQVGATTFISTFYTYPLSTTSVMPVYSITENQSNLLTPAIQEKHNSILSASAFICPSKWVASDLVLSYPGIPHESISIIYPGLHSDLKPSPPLKLRKFREERNLSRPYVIFRAGEGEKRRVALSVLIESISELVSGPIPEIVYLSIDGSNIDVPLETYLDYSKPIRAKIHELRLELSDLPTLYTGALSLFEIEPELGMSNYILEVMRSGCPVVILKEPGNNIDNIEPTLTEISNPWIETPLDPNYIAKVIDQLRDERYRSKLLNRGISFTKDMTWEKAAREMWVFINSINSKINSKN